MTNSYYDRLLRAYNSKDQKQINKVAGEIISDGNFIADFTRVSEEMDTEAFWWWMNTLKPISRQQMIDSSRDCIVNTLRKGGFTLGEDYSANPSGTVSVSESAREYLIENTGRMILHFVE